MMTELKKIDFILWELMRRTHITQKALARATGIRQPTIFRVLNRVSRDPTSHTVQALAEFFGLHPAQLRGELPIDWDALPSPHELKVKSAAPEEQLLLFVQRAAYELLPLVEALPPEVLKQQLMILLRRAIGEKRSRRHHCSDDHTETNHNGLYCGCD